MAYSGFTMEAEGEDEEIEVIPRQEESTVVSSTYILTEPVSGMPKIVVKNAKHVTTGNINIYNYGPREYKTKKIQPKKPLTECTDKPSSDNLHYISERLGKLWQKLGRCLKFEDGVLEQLDMDHTNDSNEKNYKMLTRWINAEGDQATKAQLASCLAKCGLGHLADYLADH